MAVSLTGIGLLAFAVIAAVIILKLVRMAISIVKKAVIIGGLALIFAYLLQYLGYITLPLPPLPV